MGDIRFCENHRFKVEDLLEKCWENDNWNSKDYSLSSHNCQDFVAKIIKITNAKRIGKGYRKVHNISLVNFPPPIIKAFEINENEDNSFGKIYIIGLLNDIYHWHFKKDIEEEDESNLVLTNNWMKKFFNKKN